tara:strand:- start:1106 stop:1555 length:450 start_codon:yes stop_codon:yes gene_type:complete
MRVNVYRNVKKKPSILSVRCAASGLVLGHSHHAELTDCRFVIQSSGQSQVRKTHQKNVHAWVSGNLEYITDFSSIKERRLNDDVLHITEEEVQLVRDVSEDSPRVFKRVSYDPYKDDVFTLNGTEIEVKTAEAVSVYADGTIYAREPKS